jgi:hypothetical protein
MRLAGGGNVIAVFNPVVIFHLSRRLNDEEVACLGDVVDEGLRSKAPWGMLMVFAREELGGGIEPRAREIFERLVRQDKDVLERSALVVTAAGFPGSVIRSVVAGLLQLVGKRTQLKVFSTVPEAVELVADAHGIDIAAISRAYAQAAAET